MRDAYPIYPFKVTKSHACTSQRSHSSKLWLGCRVGPLSNDVGLLLGVHEPLLGVDATHLPVAATHGAAGSHDQNLQNLQLDLATLATDPRTQTFE